MCYGVRLMRQFGVYVAEDSDPELGARLKAALKRWGVLGTRAEGEVGVRVRAGARSEIVVASTSGRSVRRAAQLVARAVGLPLVRSASGARRWERSLVDLNLGDSPAGSALDQAAWGLFLWTASRCPSDPSWQGLLPRTPPPPMAAAPVGVAVARQSQPLTKPQRPAGALLAPPPTALAPRRGG